MKMNENVNSDIDKSSVLDLKKLVLEERITLAHYDKTAQSFWQGTRDHDVSQNIEAFLQAMPRHKELDILDFGCGPGRDIYQFKHLGHHPIGLDGSQEFCRMAHDYTGCEILHQNFLSLNLQDSAYDGIFANASLFHIPSNSLPTVLAVLNRALRPKGILFCSIPRGNEEGWQGDRFGHYMELEHLSDFLDEAGFDIIHHYYRPNGLPFELQPWLAVVSRKKE